MVIDRKGGKRTLTKDWEQTRGVIWSRATDEILFVGGRTAADLALRAVSLSGRERVLLSAGGGTLVLHDVAADGRLLLERSAARIGVSCLPPGEDRERDLGWLDESVLTPSSRLGPYEILAPPGCSRPRLHREDVGRLDEQSLVN